MSLISVIAQPHPGRALVDQLADAFHAAPTPGLGLSHGTSTLPYVVQLIRVMMAHAHTRRLLLRRWYLNLPNEDRWSLGLTLSHRAADSF